MRLKYPSFRSPGFSGSRAFGVPGFRRPRHSVCRVFGVPGVRGAGFSGSRVWTLHVDLELHFVATDVSGWFMPGSQKFRQPEIPGARNSVRQKTHQPEIPSARKSFLSVREGEFTSSTPVKVLRGARSPTMLDSAPAWGCP